MKIKMMKIPVGMALVAGMLVLGGCQGVNAMPKNVLMKEGQEHVSENKGDYMSESAAKKVAISAFESVFDIKLDVSDFYENSEYDDEYEVSWSSFDPRKLNSLWTKMDELDELQEKREDRGENSYSADEKLKMKKLQDDIDMLSDEYKKTSRYKASIDLESGMVDRIEIWNSGDNGLKIDLPQKAAALLEMEKFLGRKLDVSGLLENVRVKDGVWKFEWESVGAVKGENLKCSIGIDMLTGEVMSASYNDGDDENTINMGFVADAEESKKIAVDFILDRNYVKRADKIDFLSCEKRGGGRFNELQFSYGVNESNENIKVIVVEVDRMDKTVDSIEKYEDDEEEIEDIKEEYKEDIEEEKDLD